MKPFPTLDQAYNMVLCEKSQRVFHTKTHSLIESTAMAVKKSKSTVLYSKCGKASHHRDICYSNVVWTHCGKSGHPKEKCF